MLVDLKLWIEMLSTLSPKKEPIVDLIDHKSKLYISTAPLFSFTFALSLSLSFSLSIYLSLYQYFCTLLPLAPQINVSIV